MDLSLGEVGAAPWADLTTLVRISRWATCRGREPLVEAGSAADVLALWAAEGLGGQLEADNARELLLEISVRVALHLLILLGLIDANFFVHSLDFLHVSLEDVPRWCFSPSHNSKNKY